MRTAEDFERAIGAELARIEPRPKPGKPELNGHAAPDGEWQPPTEIPEAADAEPVECGTDGKSEAAGVPKVVTPRIVPPLTIDEWLARDLEAPDSLMGAWLTTTSRMLIDGPTGLGKTLFLMQIAMRTSAGTDFVHWRAHRPCRVLYIDGEMPRRLLRERIADAVARGCRLAVRVSRS